MKPPKATRAAFPASWRKWRKIKAGEKLRFTDRVLNAWVIGPQGMVRELHSVQLGRAHVGCTVRPHNHSPYTEGYYYRRMA